MGFTASGSSLQQLRELEIWHSGWNAAALFTGLTALTALTRVHLGSVTFDAAVLAVVPRLRAVQSLSLLRVHPGLSGDVLSMLGSMTILRQLSIR